MECLCGILSNNLKDLVCLAVNQLRYPCCFNNFVEELKKVEEDLIATRNSVQDRVAHGKKQTMKTAEVVHKWLKDADIGIEDVNNLLDKAITKKSCCFGHCPNWILRYHFGRKLANKKKELEELIKKGEPFVQLERVATLPSETLYFPSDNYLKFESRESAFKQVMEAVKDEEINMIGLYGMGGCGKTTLAEEVKKIAEVEHLFDEVVFVTVSSIVDVRQIQEKIARSMRYHFQVNEEKERATALCEILTQENKILVILDDVWERVDFGAIGIPLTEHHKGCKVLITTRLEDVCTLMDCQKRIQLQILTDDEAWTLFQEQAHISEDTSYSLKHLAREISEECKGLPVAIAAVAGSLKGKNELIWRVALNRLRSSKPVNIEKGLTNPYKCLQLSYDNLDTEEAKSLFLLCSAFPEGYKIPIEVLMKLAIGLGVVGEVHSYYEAKSEVIAAKSKLVSSCLLMIDAGDDRFVKMHDLVRDVAHLIAKDENKVIKCQLDNDVTLEQSSIRYLWCKEFSNDLDCSNLEFLCIVTKLEILDEIFKRMGMLRVLYLANEREGDKLPFSTVSFKTLTNLRCLILVGWELSDTSFVRDTKKLQSLTLNRCSLPSFLYFQIDDAVKQLTNMKLLEFVECQMERNNYNVIGRIPQLEELHIIDGNQELECLVDTTNNNDLSEVGTLFSQLLQLKIWEMDNLKVLWDGCLPSSGSFQKLEKLHLQNCPELASLFTQAIVPSPVRSTIFQNLRQVEVSGCEKLKYVFSANTVRGLPKLKQLLIENCNELDQIIEDIIPSAVVMNNAQHDQHEIIQESTSIPSASVVNQSPGQFTLSNLRSLELYLCPKLRSLFSAFTAKTLTSLKELTVKYCDDLEHIVTHERVQKNEKEDIIEVDHDLQSVISMFPNLKTLEIKYCAKLEVIFPPCCLPELVSVEITECKKLKQIMEQDLLEGKSLSNLLQPELCFPKLRKLVVENCDKLKCVLSTSASIGLSSLEILIINGAAELEELIGCEHGKGQFSLSNLTSLELYLCPKLSSLFSVSTAKTLTSLKELTIKYCDALKHIITRERVLENEKEDIVEDDHDLQSVISMLPSLKTLTIIKCAKLETIFPLSCLPELESVIIKECKELKQIIKLDLEEDKNLSNLLSPKPHFPKLRKLVVENWDKLKGVLSISTSIGLSNLEILIISGAAELEELIGCDPGKGQFTLSNLTTLELYLCPKLSSLFSISTARTLTSLKELTVKYCDDLEHIVTHERVQKNEKEDIIEDENDHDLQSVILILRSLKTLTIIKCAKLETIFPLSYLPELESVAIRECNELKRIMKQDLEEDKNLSNVLSPKRHFPNLRKLVVENCNKLKGVLSTSTSIGLSNLEIHIDECAELEELIGCDPGKGHQIEKTKVELPQATVPSPGRSIILQNLQKVTITRCGKLKYVFSANTLRGQLLLKELLIRDCNELDQIIEDIIPSAPPVMSNAQHDQHEIIPEDTSIPSASLVNPGSFTLSGLTSLEVDSCPKLGSLFTASITKSFTSLEDLMIRDCHGLKHLLTCERTHEHKKEGRAEDDHDLESVILMLSSLKTVNITGCDLLQHIFCVFLVGCQNNYEDKSRHLQQKNIQIGQHVSFGLENLDLINLPQMTNIWVASKNSLNLQCLKTLKIERCAKLEVIFPLSILRCLSELERLEIKDCKELKQIIEQDLEDIHFIRSASVMNNAHAQHEIIPENTTVPLASLVNHSPGPFTLSNLTSFVLKSCPKLSSLFTVSTAKTLTSLQELNIQDCHSLKLIVTRERDDKNQKDIVEEDDNLQSVISTFPSLKRVYINVISMFRRLKKVHISGCDLLQHIFCDFLLYEDNPYHLQQKNIQIARQMSLVLEKLNLINLPQMTYIWVAAKNSVVLQYLKTIKIKGCAKLEVIFPPSVLRCLPELKSLEIRQCKELKHIMEQDLEESSPHLPQPCFPKLTKLVVEKCDKLKRVLSTSASIGLSNLEILIINGAVKLEGLFGCEHGKGHEIENAKVELPKLKLMIFMNLPNLCQGDELLAVKHRIVHTCPELALTSTTTLRELKENFPNSDFENAQLSETELQDLSDELSLKINEELQATTTSTNLKLNGMSSENPMDISQRETNIELVYQESSSEVGFPDQHALEDTINTEDIRKENIQEVSVSKGPTNKTLSTDVEGISLGGGVATHTMFSGGDILAQGSQVVEIDDKTVTRTRLGAYKRFVDLDDRQITLLVEAIAACPHLWDSCQKFSERFQAWMLKTLADMLLFLPNESASGVTPQREKEFHKLCDEAIELGFDSSWVNEMRQHVVARDPKPEQDRAQSQINELFKRLKKASNRSLLCRSTGADMVPHSQVVEQGEISVAPNDCIVAPRDEEPKEFSEIRCSQNQTYSVKRK